MAAQARRLSDKILVAFDDACRRGELDAAGFLLQALELTLTREARQARPDQRHEFGQVAEAYARLKALREEAEKRVQAFPTRSK